jgi:hypothetical protein
MNMVGNRAGNMSGSAAGSQPRGGDQGAQRGGGESFAEQAQGAMRNVADSASELWDDAYEQGGRYLRQGSQAVGNVDPATVTGWLVAGAVGFGLAWLLFGPHTRPENNMTRRMSQSSDRYR